MRTEMMEGRRNEVMWVRVGGLAVLTVLLAGCATPDLKPFADTTASLHQAVVRSQSTLQDELRAIKTAYPDADRVDAALAKFNTNWPVRIEAMNAMLDYADSLAAIVDAGQQGRASAQALGDSVNNLVSVLGPYGAATGVGVSLFTQFYGLVAQVRAAHSLGQAIERADPAVQKIAEVLTNDLHDLEGVLATMEVPLELALERPHKKGLELRNKLLASRDQEYATLADNWSTNNWPTEVRNYSAKLAELDRLLTDIDRWYQPLVREEKSLKEKLASEIRLVQEAQAGFRQWAEIHRGLAAAIKENRRPNLRVLVSTVLEIKATLEKLQKL